MVMGDRDALKQILLIALDNAFKHSSGDIEVFATQKEYQVMIQMKDHGEGIPPEKRDHVFDRFYRGEETSLIPGFGLGLSIAKALVEKQGGMIKLESKVEKGSEHIIIFPTIKS